MNTTSFMWIIAFLFGIVYAGIGMLLMQRKKEREFREELMAILKPKIEEAKKDDKPI